MSHSTLLWRRLVVPIASSLTRRSPLAFSLVPQILPSLSSCRFMASQKMKTCRSAFKRFRVRGDGSLKRNRAGSAHNTGHKGRKRATRLSQSTGIIEPKIEKRMRMLIGIYKK